MSAHSSDEQLLVTFWGTRGSISTPGARTQKYGGNTPCVSVEYGNTSVILDAGTGIRDLGIELIQHRGESLSLHLLLSHTHWDHIQGLPFFMPAYRKGTRIAIYGSSKKKTFLASVLRKQMDVNYFPVDMSAMAADLSINEISSPAFTIGRLKVVCQEQVCHPGGSVRYRLHAGRKRIVYATDVELDAFMGRGKTAPAERQLARDYLSFIRGADLLIGDGQYSESEYPTRIGWGHTSMPVLIEAACRAKVRKLAVFHHDPQHTDSFLDRLWGQYARRYKDTHPKTTIFLAREGMTLAL